MTAISTNLGPLMTDVAGLSLSAADINRLRHPLVGGVILFARNYQSSSQLKALCQQIKQVKSPSLVIACDYEGGRVQRFREEFCRIPAMRLLGDIYDSTPSAATRFAHALGVIIAHELMAHHIDFSFTPVLDLDYGRSRVIGNRAFHSEPEVVCTLAESLIAGLQQSGMAVCGKHFPGHGHVEADSHVALPIDTRSLQALEPDLLPYRRVRLDAVMPAHVVYPAVDSLPAGFSQPWLAFLRAQIGFTGVIVSDDLSMVGAQHIGDYRARLHTVLHAGGDVALICNQLEAVDQMLSAWSDPVPERAEQWQRLRADDDKNALSHYQAAKAVYQQTAASFSALFASYGE